VPGAWRADWAPLARHLTEAVPEWLVWKAADGLGGSDLDSAAPEQVWDEVERAFAAWADREGLAAVVRCGHFPSQLILVGCGGSAGRRLLQLDVLDRRFRHGRVVWRAKELLRAAIVHDGVRRLPSGPETLTRGRLISLADALATLGGRRARRSCSILPALEAERLLPDGHTVERWLADVERDHEVVRLA
jgi:hypothetical protein